MATLLQSESRRLYSWWWDSHISPKNSKWLQENLTDMDAKVKAMIKLIEEDADSFARRAEMYYKKRPELMKLVEEFYRAYRALAERYDHATGELRHAHRTMAEAFPNQIPFVLEDSPSGSSPYETEPHTPEISLPIHALLDPDDLHKGIQKNGSYSVESDNGISKKGLKQNSKFSEGRVRKGLNYEMEEREESLHDEVSELSNENKNLKAKVLSESDRAGKAESEIQNLKNAVSDMQVEKEAVLLQHQQTLEKLSSLERELNRSQKDSRRLNEQASKAQAEVQTLNEAFVKLEAERDAGFIKHKECLERISNLEGMVSHAQEEAKGHDKQAIKAEIEAQFLKNELSRLKSEKEARLLQYKQCLGKISDLKNKISIAEENARLLDERADTAEKEVKRLEKVLAELIEEKEAAALQYEHCLEKISKLESEISGAQADVKLLNSEILVGAAKLKSAEERGVLLERSNHSLRLEADNLAKKIALKDQELSEKHEELEKLQIRVQDERLRYVQVEANLQTLQNLHSQCHEEQRALTLELKNGLQMFRELEICKHGLEEEIQQVKCENRSLDEQNSSSTISLGNLQNEILGLRKMKETLEEEVAVQMGQSNALKQEIFRLNEEIKGLNRSYWALMEQVELVGLNPECLGSSVKDLQYENSKLRKICEKDRDEKEALFKKLENMEELLEKNAAIQRSLSDVNGELEGSQEKVRALQESFQFVQGEKSTLVAEKAVLLSQLQTITENIEKILKDNTLLENSLSGANFELAGLRVKSKSLEELCQLLHNEKSNLLSERNTLVVQLENVERRLEKLEKRFTQFEGKYTGLEKENKSTHSQIQEMRVSLGVEKQERASFTLWSETRLASLENHIHLLQEEGRWRKKDFQEELDKAVIAQFEIFILQKFIEDMEEKNYSLLVECQKHNEASKLTDQLISELERENLEQQVEAELLLVEIEELRLGIYQVFKALEIGPDSGSEDNIENEQVYVHHILENIENMKCCLLKYEDDQHLLSVENSVLLTLLGQLRLEALEIESEKKNLDQAFKIFSEQLVLVQSEKSELLEINTELRSKVSKGDEHANILEAEVECLYVKQGDLQRAYLELQEEYSQTLEANRSLLKKFRDLKEEKCMVEEENNVISLETLALDSLYTIFTSFGTEKATELKLLSEDLHNLHGLNSDLEKEVIFLRGKLGMKETENLLLKDSVERLEMELSGVKDSNDRMKHEILSGKDFLSQRETETSEVEQKLKATENLNSELCKTVEGLKRECEESELVRENLEAHILKLSEHNTNQSKEIECLRELNGNLESKLDTLNEEIEERKIREDNLCSELQEKSNEFELWEAEAATFYFDLQISAVREVMFESKVHELTGLCESLEDESASKTLEIEHLKERVSFVESEIGGQKAQKLAYAPAIVSLRDNRASIDCNTLSRTNFIVADHRKPKDAEVAVVLDHKKCSLDVMEDQISPIPDGISDLQELQTRIKAVEIKSLARQESLSSDIRPESSMREIEELKSKRRSVQEKDKQKEDWGHGDKLADNPKSHKTKPKISKGRTGILMKDIPLDQVSDGSLYRISRRANGGADDQMLELWQTVNEIQKQTYDPAEDDIDYPSSELQVEKELAVDKLQVSTSLTVPNRSGRKGKVLVRLASDAQKLANLQSTVENLRQKLETNKKSKKAKDGIDFETVKEQLQEVQDTVVQLVNLNGQLLKNIEESHSCSGKASGELEGAVDVQRKRVTEQARKGSEKIGRLQLEVQKIQYMLLKMEDGKKSKGKSRFSRTGSRTTIILRDFIYNGRRSGEKKKKARLCGCFRPSSNGDGNLHI